MPNTNFHSNHSLQPAQQEAIHHLSGAMLVLAGPGSGKTYVITNRIKYLITNHHIPPERILVVTFTKAAATEMRNRALTICPEAQETVFGTFHSIFYHILKQTREYQDFTPLLQNEKESIVMHIMRVFVEESQLITMCSDFILLQSYMKNNGFAWEDYKDKFEEIKNQLAIELVEEQVIIYQKVAVLYEKECKLLKKMDFDDMLYCCKQKLEKDTMLHEKWKSRFSYILVDEFQDTNQIQYDMLRFLTDYSKNIFAVGDDDQQIYSFRGGNFKYMKALERDYAPCKICQLNVNFRSYQKIVMASKRLIEHNHERYQKALIANSGENGEVVLQAYETEAEEIKWIRQIIDENSQQIGTGQMECAQICVLCRTNKERVRYEKVLLQSANNDVANPICMDIVLDVIAMINMILGSRKRTDFFRIMNKPNRGLQRCFIQETVSFAALKEQYRHSAETVLELTRLEKTLNMAYQLDPMGGILFAFHQLGYENFVRTDYALVKNEVDNKEAIEMALTKIKELAKETREWTTFLASLEKLFISEKQRTDIIKRQQREAKDKICVMTYHASKGLEYDTVILPGIKEGLVPYGRMLTANQLEEERRVFYVAMTRAKKNLYISYYRDAQAENQVSIFIKELVDD